jgi:3',5'-cyclic AMP phosphodiesterase CpdA
MKLSRRNFLGFSTLVGLSGCARIEKTKLGKITPEFECGDDGVLKFATMGDLHMLDSRSAGIVGRAVNQINNDKAIDFTVVLGDLTTHGTLPEANLALQSLGRLKKPYYCIPGERDNNPTGGNNYEFYQRAFKKTQWRESSAGWVLIGLDTCDGTLEEPAVTQASLDWLKDQLNHTEKKKPIALFTHHPLSPGTQRGRASNADDVLALFTGHNLKLVASGHYHGNQEEERDGILFVTTAPCSATVDNDDGTTQKGFRVFTMEGETIQHEFIAVS